MSSGAPEKLIIKGGVVVDPINEIRGDKLDIFVSNGKICEEFDEKNAKIIDAAGNIVVAGAIDPHAHLITTGSFLRYLVPVARKAPTYEIIREYVRLGWTTISLVGPSIPEVLHVHTILRNIGFMDYAIFPRIDNDQMFLSLVRTLDIAGLATYLSIIAKNLQTLGFYMVPPGILEGQVAGQDIKSLKEKIRVLDISPLEAIMALFDSIKRIGSFVPVQIEAPGLTNSPIEELKEIIDVLGDASIFVPHLSYHLLGEDISTEELLKLFEGGKIFGDIGVCVDRSISVAPIKRVDGYKNIRWFASYACEMESFSLYGLLDEEFAEKQSYEILKNALMLAIKGGRKDNLSISGDIPLCSEPKDLAIFMCSILSKECRKEVIGRHATDDLSALPDVNLIDVIQMTRASPAKALGIVEKKGHLGIGADADIVIYDFDIERQDPSRDWKAFMKALLKPKYVIKSGQVVVVDGEITSSANSSPIIGRAKDIDQKEFEEFINRVRRTTGLYYSCVVENRYRSVM